MQKTANITHNRLIINSLIINSDTPHIALVKYYI